jgi:hypothetical protein
MPENRKKKRRKNNKQLNEITYGKSVHSHWLLLRLLLLHLSGHHRQLRLLLVCVGVLSAVLHAEDGRCLEGAEQRLDGFASVLQTLLRFQLKAEDVLAALKLSIGERTMELKIAHHLQGRLEHQRVAKAGVTDSAALQLQEGNRHVVL